MEAHSVRSQRGPHSCHRGPAAHPLLVSLPADTAPPAPTRLTALSQPPPPPPHSHPGTHTHTGTQDQSLHSPSPLCSQPRGSSVRPHALSPVPCLLSLSCLCLLALLLNLLILAPCLPHAPPNAAKQTDGSTQTTCRLAHSPSQGCLELLQSRSGGSFWEGGLRPRASLCHICIARRTRLRSIHLPYQRAGAWFQPPASHSWTLLSTATLLAKLVVTSSQAPACWLHHQLLSKAALFKGGMFTGL